MRRLIVCALLFIASPCRLLAETEEVPSTGVPGTVFIPTAKDKNYWVPTTSQILLLEKIFSPYVQYQINEYAASRHIYATPDQSKYTRQYRGVFRKGVKMIEIQGMCGKQDLEKLKHKVFALEDGGWCYFSAQFDPTKNILVQFAFNGES
jgi:hypothetical protein